MTIFVTIDIRCDWCKRAIAGTGCGISHSTIAIDDTVDAAVQLEQRIGDRGVAILSPPGHQMHLCRACVDRERPPASNHAHRVRLLAEAAVARRAKKAAT